MHETEQVSYLRQTPYIQRITITPQEEEVKRLHTSLKLRISSLGVVKTLHRFKQGTEERTRVYDKGSDRKIQSE